MTLPTDPNLTSLIQAASRGDEAAEELLFDTIYDSLRGIARRQVRRNPDEAIQQATGLVHESFLRFFRDRPRLWESRGEFLATFTREIKHALIDAARRRGRVGLTVLEDDPTGPREEFERLDFEELTSALEALELEHPRQAKVLRNRYFLGVSIQEIAAEEKIGETTARAWIDFARCWLRTRLVPRT